MSLALDHDDRRRLREVVRKTFMRQYPTQLLTDREADRIIEAFAPETAERLLMKGMISGLTTPAPTVVGGTGPLAKTRLVPKELAFPEHFERR